MSEPDRTKLRVIPGALSHGTGTLYVPRIPTPLPEDDEGTIFDRSARDVLERFERAHELTKAEEGDR